jgi:hypothetical protein
MIDLAADTLTQLATSPAPYLNSNFVTSLAGAGAGAWAGAYAAQRIAARTLERNELLSEIRNMATSFNLAVLICNVFLGLKGQHIERLKTAYDRKKGELQEIIRRRDGGELPADFQWEFAADFQTLTPILTPVDKLQNLVFEKLTSKRRTIVFASMLSQTVHLLNDAFAERTRLIEEFRQSGPHSQAQLFQFYFALPDQQGTIDDRYGTILTAIHRYADDCIYFSKSIADDLSASGKTLERLFEKKFRSKAPSVGVMKIEKEEYLNLLPDAREYSSWDGLA